MAVHYGSLNEMAKAQGTPITAGIIITGAGTAQDNVGTATPFDLEAGETYLVQADAACHLKWSTLAAATDATTSATGSSVKLAADEKGYFRAVNEGLHLSVIGSAVVNLKVWRMA
jgi:hypothetical protein